MEVMRMENLKISVQLNMEMENLIIMQELSNVCTELSLSPEQFILYSLEKLLHDIQFVRKLRLANKDLNS